MVLDDASVDWYLYHFNDSLLQYDVHWRMWRDTAQAFLEHAQLDGEACAVCGKRFLLTTPYDEEFVGGYNLRVCINRCEFREEVRKL